MRLAGRYPMFRLVVAFAAGIVTGMTTPGWDRWMLVLLGASGVGLLLAESAPSFINRFSNRWASGFLLSAAFLAFGYLYLGVRSESRHPGHYTHTSDGAAWAGVIRERLVGKPKTWKTIVDVSAVQRNGVWHAAVGRLLVYIEKDSLAETLRYGDLLCFAASPREIDGPRNPGAFDYRRFMRYRQVERQVYLSSGRWWVRHRDHHDLKATAIGLRAALIRILESHIGTKREFAIASALLLGADEHVDAGLEQAYSGAGVIHVLAVSGLHVGIIFLAWSMLLGWMDRWKYTRHLKFVLLIGLIWSYAMLTGFSPSVMRASAMLTFVIVGVWSGRDPQAGHSILAAAFFLLLFDPYLIAQVGFQLSFLAVIGICFIHPYVYRLWEPSGYTVHRAWELASVSVSAQIMTFPLVLLYFRQFPNTFFISNLAVIPLATVAIYSGMLMLALAFVGNTLKLLIVISFGSMYCMNRFVVFIERLPYSVSNIYVSLPEALLLYGFIGLVALFFIRRHSGYFIAALAALLLFVCSRALLTYERSVQRQFIVYHIPGHAAFDFISGRRHLFYRDPALTRDDTKVDFVLRGWQEKGLEEYRPMDLDHMRAPFVRADAGFVRFLETKIRFEDRSIGSVPRSVNRRIITDYLVLTGNRYQDTERLLTLYDPGLVIIDATYSYRRATAIRDACRRLGVRCHSVRHEGAFVAEL